MTAGLDRLSEKHKALIKASGISDDVAAARGYRTATTKAYQQELGFSRPQCKVPALVLPVHSVTGEIVLYQIRPDEPRVVKGKSRKYETPAGSRLAIDVPPGARGKLGDPSGPLYITEGIRKADAAVSAGLCCIDMLGVWGWKGTNEWGGKTALPDWDSIAVNGRTVFVVFDSDVMFKREVHLALVKLKSWLESHCARVGLVYLPEGPGGEKVGLDDFLAAGHKVEELVALSTDEPRHFILEADAPAGLYEKTPSGLVYQKPTRDGPVPTPLTNFTATITSEILRDDGVQRTLLFEIEAVLSGKPRRFAVEAARFSNLDWVTEHLGAAGVVYAGNGTRDHARTAIQLLSPQPLRRTVYTHTGWRLIDNQWAYLHADGAIGTAGTVPDVVVDLPQTLRAYTLPNPPTSDVLRDAIRNELELLELGPPRIMFPLFSATWRSVVTPSDFAVHLVGPTGVFKTEIAALFQQHFGSEMDARHLPGAWSGTSNSLEVIAFSAKDAILVVDDYAPSGTASDLNRFKREADRLLRAQGNRSGRSRLASDGTLRPSRPPRGLIVSTGEEVPLGHSIRARVEVVEVEPGAVSPAKLTACQEQAKRGTYALVMSGFLRWMAGRYDEITERLKNRSHEIRISQATAGAHLRTVNIEAELVAALEIYLDFTLAAGALSEQEADALLKRGRVAMAEASVAQTVHQAGADPVDRFLRLLNSALASGGAHVAGPDGMEPNEPGGWGWRHREFGAGENTREEWQAQGSRVGWVKDDDLYLDADAALKAAQEMAVATADGIAVTSRTLAKRLHERGILKEIDRDRDRLVVRKTLDKKRRDVLHLRTQSLIDVATSQSSQPSQPEIKGTNETPSAGSPDGILDRQDEASDPPPAAPDREVGEI